MCGKSGATLAILNLFLGPEPWKARAARSTRTDRFSLLASQALRPLGFPSLAPRRCCCCHLHRHRTPGLCAALQPTEQPLAPCRPRISHSAPSSSSEREERPSVALHSSTGLHRRPQSRTTLAARPCTPVESSGRCAQVCCLYRAISLSPPLHASPRALFQHGRPAALASDGAKAAVHYRRRGGSHRRGAHVRSRRLQHRPTDGIGRAGVRSDSLCMLPTRCFPQRTCCCGPWKPGW